MATETIDKPELDDDTVAAESAAEESAAVDSAGEERTVGAKPRRVAPMRTARVSWRIVAAGVAIAALLAAAGFFGFRFFSDDGPAASAASSDTAVLAVANDYAVKLSSFDYRDLDKNRASITAMSTPDFGKKYGEMVGALTEIVANGQGEATAEVTHSAVASLEGDQATVLLFVDQTAKNVVAPDGRSQPYRMVVKLKKVDGTWLVDDVQTV